jgi:hypothetical protein
MSDKTPMTSEDGLDRDRIAQWIRASSSAAQSAAETNPPLTARSDVSPDGNARNRSHAPNADNPLEFIAARGQLALVEAGLNNLTHQTKTTWNDVSDYWFSLLPSCGQCSECGTTAATQSAQSLNPEREKAAMLFNEYEKVKRSKQPYKPPS